MADFQNPGTQTTVEEAGNTSDTDSGIGTGSSPGSSSQSASSTPSQSASNTPSQSASSTPSQSEASTPTTVDRDFEFFSTEAMPSHQTQSSTQASAAPMDEDPIPRQDVKVGDVATPAGPGTSSRCPQMDREGFYIPQAPKTRTMQVFIRNFHGKLEQVQISEEASVDELKKMLHNKMGIPPSQQRLNYQGREFVSGNSLRSYGVQNHSEVQLLGRLRGGNAI